ncbi:hypothetical protein RGQ29_021676 [Quercus rubra]|uniref:Secreted protein n=1 Tax=Quercus rubra TaxID=3512 RepID=A0AAN7FDJ2_QUERU|nr:hypothetical protein RGQ29_021676 [Quercus rubra]
MWYLKPCLLLLLLLLLRRQQWWKETPPPSAPRMIADPAFLCKLLLEQAAVIGCSVYLELKNHKDRFVLYL